MVQARQGRKERCYCLLCMYIMSTAAAGRQAGSITQTYFDIDNGDGGLGLVKVACHPVHGFWYKIKHQI